MKYIDNIRESLARILIFVMVCMHVISNGSIIPVFAEAFTREHEDGNIASASNAIQNGKVSLRNLDQKDLELLVKSDSSRYESGDVIYLDVYLKNNSSTKVTDGVLKFSGKGLIKEDGYFEDYQDGYNSKGPGGSSDFEEPEEEDEEEELESSDEIGTISEDGKLSNIVLKPDEVYHVGFYCTVDEFEDMKSSNISFTFRGKQDKRTVSTSNKFEYTIGGMNLMPIILDEEIEAGEEYTMSLDFDLGSKFEEIIEDKILEDEADEEDIEIKEEKETEETESGTKEELETNSETESNETDNKMESSEITEETESKIEEDIKDSLGDKDSEDSIEETNDKEIESDIEEKDNKDKEDNPELSIEKIERHTVKSSLDSIEEEIEETDEAIEEDSDTEESIKETVSDDTVSDEEDKKDTELEIEYETNSDNTNVDETESKDTNSIDETEASKEETSETEAEANEIETSEDETKANETETSEDNVKNDLDLASPSNIDLDKKDKDKDKIQVATPSNSYIKWDTEDINKGEKPIIKDIKCEVSSYGVELENFEIAEGGNELNTRLNVKFRVNEDQEPGVYFGKVEATYKYKNKTYKTSQGFIINVLGEVIDLDEEITLVGSLGDTEVTVSGPRRSFPIADELELSVSEVETDKQNLVNNVLSEKQEELGLGISGVKALDIKVLADGEYKELNGDVTVNFKNVGLQGVYGELEFNEEELEEIAKVNDLGQGIQLLSLDDELEEVTEVEQEVNNDTMVYHLDEDKEELTEMESSLTEDGDIEMETNHFSIYIIVNFEVTNVEVKVTHWANVNNFTLENGGLEDIKDLDGDYAEIAKSSNFYKHGITLRLKETKYKDSFKSPVLKEMFDFTKMNNGVDVPTEIFPGKVEIGDTFEYPKSYMQIYTGDTYKLPGWATQGIPYTLLLDKLSKINNVEDKNYEIVKATITMAESKEQAELGNKHEIVFEKVDGEYRLISGNIHDTSLDKRPDGIDEDDILLELGKYNEIKFDYVETTGVSEINASFHDYNLGDLFLLNKDEFVRELYYQKTDNYYTYNGINAPIVRNEDGEEIITPNKYARFYIGGGSLNVTNPRSWFKVETNPANTNKNEPELWLAKLYLRENGVKEDSNGNELTKYEWDGLAGTLQDPGIFYEGNLYSDLSYTIDDKTVVYEKDILAKEYLPNYKLGFLRYGDTYVLNNVVDNNGNTVLEDLDRMKFTAQKYNKAYPLYSNLFWPLDNLAERNNSSADALMPINSSFPNNDEGAGVKHNWLFGMTTELTFDVREYTGPLNYYFKGDDDLWVYIDGKRMIDLGGVHSSVGSFVDIKEWLIENRMARLDDNGALIPIVDGQDDIDHIFTMSIFYTERGGTGSCCYMMYTLPKVKHFEVPIYKTIKHTVSKKWNDNGDESKRPDSIVVQIYQNDEPYGEEMILNESDVDNDDEVWEWTWNNLPAYDENGVAYRYEIREVNTNSDDYIQTSITSTPNKTNLINTVVADKIVVNKEWVDVPDNVVKPDINVALYKYSYFLDSEHPLERNDIDVNKLELVENTPIKTLNASTNWECDWDRLPAYENDGRKIVYLAYEVELDNDGTIKKVLDNKSTTTDNEYYVTYNENTIINTYNLMPLSATKVWSNSDKDEEEHRPETVGVKLYQNKNEYREGSLNKNNNWTCKFDNVPIRSNGGEEYKYEILEIYRGEPLEENGIITIDNKYQYIVTYLPRALDTNNRDITINNSWRAVEKLDINVTKYWEKEDNGDKPVEDITEVSVGLFVDNELRETIVLNNENNWTYTWENLEKYSNILDRTEYKYEVRELLNGNRLEEGIVRLNGKDKYEVSYKESTENDGAIKNVDITNKFKAIDKVDVTVLKKWIDSEAKEGLAKNSRPSKGIKVQLYRDGEVYGNPVTIKGSLYDDKDDWKYTWTNLDEYHIVDGKEVNYAYTVKELDINGKPLENGDTCRFNGVDKYEVSYVHDDYVTVINNSFIEPERTKVKVNKIWIKDNLTYEPDNMDSIKVQLYAFEEDYDVPREFGEPVELTKDNNWSYEWDNMLVKTNDDREKLYTYTVKELDTNGRPLENGDTCRFNGIDKYEVSYSNNSEYELTINNTWIEPPTLTLEVVKEWDNDTEDMRPDSIEMYLYQIDADGKKVLFKNDIILNKDNNWRESLIVPAQDLKDRDYDYRITEVVGGKELKEDDKEIFNNNRYQVNYYRGIVNKWELIAKNSFIPRDIIDIQVSKEWVDNDESTRPSNITVELLRDGKRFNQDGIETKVNLSVDSDWSYIWNNLYKTDLYDIEYKYSVVEIFNNKDLAQGEIVKLNGRDKYQVSYTEESETNKIITNTYIEPDMTSVMVEKVWVNASEKPDSITVKLYQGNLVYDIITLNDTNNWSNTWIVPMYDFNDNEYVYYVKEVYNNKDLSEGEKVSFDTNNNFTVNYSTISGNSFRITNTQDIVEVPPEKPEAPPKKPDTPPSGGGNTPETPDEPPVEEPSVEEPEYTNPVPNIQRTIKNPLIGIYDIMDNMIPLANNPIETIEDNDTPLFGMPGTGDKTNLGKYFALCLLSTLGLFGLAFKNKKEEKD